MKNLTLTILINLTLILFLYSQESDDFSLLIYSNKDILTSSRWSCLNVKLSDTLLLDNDSIMLEKSGLIKKQEIDTSLEKTFDLTPLRRFNLTPLSPV